MEINFNLIDLLTLIGKFDFVFFLLILQFDEVNPLFLMNDIRSTQGNANKIDLTRLSF